MQTRFSILAYRNRLLLLLGVVALCGALVACSRMASKPEMPEPVDPAVVAETAPQIEMSLRTMLLALTNPEILAVPQTDGPEVLASCRVESTGDATDADGDQYPVAETRTYECDLFIGSRTASLELMDKDDADATSGVKAEATQTYSLGVAEEPGLSFPPAEMSLDVSRSDGAADYEIAYRGSFGLPTPFVEIKSAGMYDATLVGTFVAGTVSVQGGLTITTTLTDCATVDADQQEECRQAVQDAPSGSLGLRVTTTGLVYDAVNCATTFMGGYFEVTSPAGNVLKSTYDGCGPPTVTYDGQPVPPPELPG